MTDHEVITNDDGAIGVYVSGPEPSDDERQAAARAAIAFGCEVAQEDFVSDGRVVALREHTTDKSIDAAGCGCEGAGWVCPEGDGQTSHWLWLDA